MIGIGQLTRAQHAGLIRAQNDAFRICPSGGKVKLTFGVLEKFRGALDELISAIISFDDFSEDNDPYEEHDFGCLSHHTTITGISAQRLMLADSSGMQFIYSGSVNFCAKSKSGLRLTRVATLGV